MAEYRVYLVDRDGHFYDVVHPNCADDAEAQRARYPGDEHERN